jgi:hypothetical protein
MTHEICYDGQGEVDARGHASASNPVAVPHNALLYGFNAEQTQLIDRGPVARCPVAAIAAPVQRSVSAHAKQRAEPTMRARTNRPDRRLPRSGSRYGLRPSQLSLGNASSYEGGQPLRKPIHLSTTGPSSGRSPPRLKARSARWLKIHSARTAWVPLARRINVSRTQSSLACVPGRFSSRIGRRIHVVRPKRAESRGDA